MDWKKKAIELCGDALENSIAVADVRTETLAKAIRLMIYHWPDEVEQAKQHDDAKSMAFMANTIQAAHEALGTEVGDDLVMACERFRKDRDELQTALAEQMKENGWLAKNSDNLRGIIDDITGENWNVGQELQNARDAYEFAVEELKREAIWRKHYESRLMKESWVLNPPKICYPKR